MKEINFSNRSWQSISDAYLKLKTRYRRVKFTHNQIHGLFSGYFIVSSYKKYNYA
jgi:hypothetical protein